MKKSVSIVYAVFVITALICIIGLFAWRIYQSRAARISDFVMRSDEYSNRLDEALHRNREGEELEGLANELMSEDPSIVAIQVYSKENKLRLSIVKPAIRDFWQTPIIESDHFDRPFTRVLYYKITKSMPLNDGFKATFVSQAITTSEIRSKLVIVLIVVSSMFLITFILILVTPRRKSDKQGEVEPSSEYEEDSKLDFPSDSGIESRVENPEDSEYIAQGDDANGTYYESDEDIDDFAPADRLDENDLRVTKPEYGESVSMEGSDLPSLDENKTEEKTEIMNRLNKELEDSAASNQDLSLVIIAGDSSTDEFIREHYSDSNLVLPIDHRKTAVIEANKDLDTSISTAKEFLRERLSKNSNSKVFCGIAARNGRLISADVLYREASSALLKADRESRIVGFRSDPEKYRDFIRNQKGS